MKTKAEKLIDRDNAIWGYLEQHGPSRVVEIARGQEELRGDVGAVGYGLRRLEKQGRVRRAPVQPRVEYPRWEAMREGGLPAWSGCPKLIEEMLSEVLHLATDGGNFTEDQARDYLIDLLKQRRT